MTGVVVVDRVRRRDGGVESPAAKSPAELIADLTDQVRLLRQDVGNLTATATTKAEAAKLMAGMQKAAEETFEHA